jgi:hypothetical protein
VVHVHYRDVTERRQLERRLRGRGRRLRELSAFGEAREQGGVSSRTLCAVGQLFSSIRLELGASCAFRDRSSRACAASSIACRPRPA